MAIGLLDVNAIGNLGRDPETSVAASGIKVTRFSIAVNRKRKNEEKTTWLNVVTFDKLAEITSQYLRKGSLVFVKGELDVRKYTGQDGVEKTSVDLVANQVVFLEKKRDAVEQQSGPAVGEPGFTDDDIPF